MNLPPFLKAVYASLALSADLKPLYILRVAFVNLPRSKVFAIVLPNLAILYPVRVTAAASDTGFKPPCKAAAPHNANSSTAIDPITPKVYPDCKKRLFKN